MFPNISSVSNLNFLKKSEINGTHGITHNKSSPSLNPEMLQSRALKGVRIEQSQKKIPRY